MGDDNYDEGISGKQKGGGRREGILVGATQRLKAVATEVPACKGELNNCNIKNRTKITLWLNLIISQA